MLRAVARANNAIVVGPNSPGILSPGSTPGGLKGWSRNTSSCGWYCPPGVVT